MQMYCDVLLRFVGTANVATLGKSQCPDGLCCHCADQWSETTAQRQHCVVHIVSVRREVLHSVAINKCTHCTG